MRVLPKLLGVDPGQRWVGVAATDDTTTVASPLETIDRENQNLLESLRVIVRKKAIDKIIVGYPEPLRTDENERTRQVDEFIEEFLHPLDIPFETYSERYTTKQAERLRENRDNTPDEATDAEAAAVILRKYLDQPLEDGTEC